MQVLRWSAVGVQGALLSHVLPPVYLASVTVNVDEELYQTEPALAGLAKRLPLPFAVTQPDVVQAYSFVKGTIEVEAGTPMTECGESWALGDEGLETLRQADGKREDGGEPRLSRRQIFEQFRKLQGSSTQSRCLESTDDTTGQQPGAPSFESVEAAKRAAVRYQAAKEVLSEFLMERSRAESCAGNGIVALDVAKPTTAT